MIQHNLNTKYLFKTRPKMQIDINKYDDTTFILKDYFRAPIFTVKPTGISRSVKVQDKIWTIGIDNPLTKDEATVKDLTIEHALIIFGIFAFTNPLEFNPKIPFSLNQLCQVIYNCSNTSTYKKATKLLNELLYCWTSIEYPDGTKRIFRVLKNVDVINKKPRRSSKNYSPELWLDGVELHEEFYKLVYEIENRLFIKLGLIKQLTSNLARTIYLYIPSRAIRATENNSVFKITLSKLLEQIGYPAPAYKSKRHQLFIQHDKTSIINQLNKSELIGNRILRCKLEETKDKKDYNLICWVESKMKTIKEPKSTLYKAFKASGGSMDIWKEKLSEVALCEFNSYEKDALEYFPFWKKSEKFLKMSKCLLGDYFAEYLGVVKNHLLEDKTINKSPMHMLNYELIRAFKNVKITE